MSYEAMAKVRGSGLTDATTVDVLEALAFCLNDKTGKCCPSTETIARIARRSANVVRQTIKKLESDGLISSAQLPGRERHFTLFLEHLPKAEPLTEVKGVAEVKPLSEVKGDPFQKCKGTPYRSERGPLSEVKPEQGSEQGREQGNEQVVVGPFDQNPPPLSDEEIASMGTEPEPADLFNGAVEMVEPPPKEKPAPKPKRTRGPLVTLPETLPDDWRALATERRPDIDPDDLLEKMRTYYGPLAKKALRTWKQTFLNWLVKERKPYANNRNNRGGWQQPSPEVLASIDYGAGTWGY